MSKDLINKNDGKVRQSNDFVESPYSQEFTVTELKILEISIANCKIEDIELVNKKNNKEFRFPSKELAKILNTSSSVISQEADRISNSIMKKHIDIKKTLGDGSVEFEKITIIPYSKYIDGSFEFHLNYKLIPYFISINSNFTEYQLNHLLSMRSAYSIKLYKLLYQYKNIKIRTFYITDLKNQFGIPNKYPEYKNFKQRILEPSIQHINELTDLNVKYKEIKYGRKVEKLEFSFSLKKYTSIVESLINIDSIEKQVGKISDTDITGLLTSIDSKISCSTKAVIMEYYKIKGYEYIKFCTEYAIKNSKSNFDKYLIDTLVKGWADLEIKKNITNYNNSINEKKIIQQKHEEKLLVMQKIEVNKLEIERKWNDLLDLDKLKFIDYANNILNKHSHNLSKFNNIEHNLPICIYAVSNNLSYEKILESYVGKILGIVLDINYIKGN